MSLLFDLVIFVVGLYVAVMLILFSSLALGWLFGTFVISPAMWIEKKFKNHFFLASHTK